LRKVRKNLYLLRQEMKNLYQCTCCGEDPVPFEGGKIETAHVEKARRDMDLLRKVRQLTSTC
jgi:hypothetical protein